MLRLSLTVPHVLASLLVASVFACDRASRPTQPPQEIPTAPNPSSLPPGPLAEDPSFSLRLAHAPNGQGGEPRISISLRPKPPFHVNQEYPISVRLQGPAGVVFAKPALERVDATRFSETEAEFETSFRAPEGTHEVRADVSFAVCTPESCMPDDRTLVLRVPVTATNAPSAN